MNNLKDIQGNNPMNYETYYKLVEDLVAENKTTGPNQTEALANYTKLNLQRMKRWNKRAIPSEEIVNALEYVPFRMKWIMLTEGWCGDAAQNIPYIAKLADSSDKVEMELYLRDENPEIMNRYLTNGSMSIPKMALFNAESGEEVGVWGPRPLEVQNLVMHYKANLADTIPYHEFTEQVHMWYAKNRNENLEKELLSLLKSIA